jgi:hypothetical protein
MEVGPRWTGVPVVHTPWTVHGFFNSRINPKIGYFRNFAKRPLSFFEISPQSTKVQ